MAVSFPFYPEHVPLQSAFLSGSDHTSIVFEEVESSTLMWLLNLLCRDCVVMPTYWVLHLVHVIT